MNTPTNPVATARRILHAQEAKAAEIAPFAQTFCEVAGTDAKYLETLPDHVWLTWAREADKAGPKGEDVPSAWTRARVVDLVEAAFA